MKKLDIKRVDNGLLLTGRLDAETAMMLFQAAAEIPERDGGIVLDLSGIRHITSAGVAVLDDLAESRSDLSLTGMDGETASALESFGTRGLPPLSTPENDHYFERLGNQAIDGLRGTAAFLILLVDSFYWAITGLFKKGGHRKGSFTQQAVFIGVDAFPVVGLTSFLVGLIMAILSAGQLRQFGANILVADLVAIAMAREMGPIMTAIIMAGRSGSAIASEIATMKVTEEIDALKTMALSPVRFVVVPKIWAITVVLPLLTLLSVVIGISGGMAIGFIHLDIFPGVFLAEVSRAISLGDLLTGMGKSVIFSWLVVITASFFGMRAVGGPEGVGKVTTSSVVVSIFLVIIADALMALILYL